MKCKIKRIPNDELPNVQFVSARLVNEWVDEEAVDGKSQIVELTDDKGIVYDVALQDVLDSWRSALNLVNSEGFGTGKKEYPNKPADAPVYNPDMKYDLVLLGCKVGRHPKGRCDYKIHVIKTIREFFGLSLLDAKNALDNVPTTLVVSGKQEDLLPIHAALLEAGACAELRPLSDKTGQFISTQQLTPVSKLILWGIRPHVDACDHEVKIFSDSKIRIIKLIRSLFGFSLKTAKDATEKPTVLKIGPKTELLAMEKALYLAGALVEIRDEVEASH